MKKKIIIILAFMFLCGLIAGWGVGRIINYRLYSLNKSIYLLETTNDKLSKLEKLEECNSVVREMIKPSSFKGDSSNLISQVVNEERIMITYVCSNSENDRVFFDSFINEIKKEIQEKKGYTVYSSIPIIVSHSIVERPSMIKTSLLGGFSFVFVLCCWFVARWVFISNSYNKKPDDQR